ncbi:GntR family transcriptional regulator [Streptomyces varsoviensis]|uniref:GntR family transcriptional regulator n=1 Tax=Streptomyces varsoviensis TaxID=67373 RepID=A0ABR5J4L1_9ACTN|nr:GntR family transcriptional regulator [Streptomyces varsoviensis]KOG88297.1 GntR family transcriptional regulator [Streptomyces varsoviensis]
MSGRRPYGADTGGSPRPGSSQPRARRARQVADVLRQQITGGAFDSGTLPDERALGAQFHASRNAVREALGILRDEGLIARRRGVGTTVLMPKYGHGLDRLAGLAETLTGYGPLTNEVRAAHRVAEPPAAVAERLSLAPGTGAVYIERVRRMGGLPLSLDATYLAADIGVPLLDLDLAGRDLFALIEETTGGRLGRAEVAVHAVTAGPDVAGLLDVPVGAAVFAIDRLTHLADGRPVDAESLHIRADRLTLHATLHRGAPHPG